ncbi:hypothetical protein IU485_27520 [Nocardia cyriacigeorgica]|uniref:hypothetical protein n=1 Tax=Nocardia cyriacigeorgica TaxID=135487 RepID=UPI001895E505|nr:hypothetical protein [Nocardia cyriacigeorgica]MBF6085126.1 hypothetical protein [Nocardia cyriacigeorgica]
MAATLMTTIGTVYPGARVDQTIDRVLRMRIPNDERYATPADRSRIEAAKRLAAETDAADLVSLRNGIAFAQPDAVSHTLGLLASEFLRHIPGAVNYAEAEMDVRDPDTTESFVLTVRRANGKTPHQLRQEAEAEVERLRAEIAELKASQ